MLSPLPLPTPSLDNTLNGATSLGGINFNINFLFRRSAPVIKIEVREMMYTLGKLLPIYGTQVSRPTDRQLLTNPNTGTNYMVELCEVFQQVLSLTTKVLPHHTC